MHKAEFIVTSDEETKVKLEKMGLYSVAVNIPGKYFFVNNQLLTFDGIDETKIAYTDKLFFRGWG